MAYNKNNSAWQAPEVHIFYDTETTGADPRYDQVLQTAAIVTDAEFNEIETIDIRSRLARHIVPAAGALKVTHVDPYEIARAPFSPFEYARHIHGLFSQWSANKVASFNGFNTLRFDEEILRQMFWENLLDPYVTTSGGNIRSDYLHFLRALYARNPEVIDFPLREDTGKRSFKLELVAPANGFEGHNAHDALGDVRATIFIASLIKEVDPALYHHLEMMGSSKNVADFVEEKKIFRMLGGKMLDPGILDVCLIASEAVNKKSKVAWNLGVNPEPFLKLSPEEILEKMKVTGTPFRTLKCNKTPTVFPTNWEFLQEASGEDWGPVEEHVAQHRAEQILNDAQFKRNVEEALRLKVDGYDAPETLEQRIYSGFPSWQDKNLMKSFHNESDWGRRLEIARSFDQADLRKLGLRTIYVNAPEALSHDTRSLYDQVIADTRHGLREDLPWHTVGKLMAEIHEMLTVDPEDEEALNIKAWALETYPLANHWAPTSPTEVKVTVQSTSADEDEIAQDENDPSFKSIRSVKMELKKGDALSDAPPPPLAVPSFNLQRTVAGISHLDGLD